MAARDACTTSVNPTEDITRPKISPGSSTTCRYNKAEQPGTAQKKSAIAGRVGRLDFFSKNGWKSQKVVNEWLESQNQNTVKPR